MQSGWAWRPSWEECQILRRVLGRGVTLLAQRRQNFCVETRLGRGHGDLLGGYGSIDKRAV